MENNEVIKKFNERDEIAFKLIFNSFYPGLVKWGESIINDFHESEDVVCVVFTRLWSSNKELGSYEGIKQYLYQSVKNECINYIRLIRSKKRYIKELIEEEVEDYYDLPIDDYLIDKLKFCIDAIPEHYGKLILLDLKGYSDKEISSMTGFSINKIDVYRWRAKQILKKLLNKK